MHPELVGLIILGVVYLTGFIWSHRYWSKHMNENNIKLCPQEIQIIFSMLFLWFFYWDSIGIIMKNADRV